MEVLVRGGSARGSALACARGRGRVLLASYRTKRNQAKRSQALGAAPSSERKKETPARDAKEKRSRSSGEHRGERRGEHRGEHRGERRVEGKRATAPEAEHRPSVAEIEEQWSAMRARTIVVPPPVMPARTRKEIENTMRMRRLGLLPDDADGEWEGYAESRERPELRAGRPRQQPLGLQREQSSSSSHRYPSRRPVAAKDKQFTNMVSAPEEVVEREFLIPDEPDQPKALDIAVIGRPNAGKSSIMNGLLDVTVSAVSAKYNTTRDRVLGILTKKDTQITFYDTPGLIKPKESHEYVRSLVTTAAETVESVDMSMLVVDAVKRLDEDAIDAMAKVVTTSAQVSSPLMLVMNKYDLVGEREELNLQLKIKDISEMIEEIYANNFDAEESSLELDPLAYIGENALKVSALKGYGMKRLKKTLMSLAVDRPWNYHSSMKSDQSDLDLVTEIIREKLFRRFNKELPYSFEQENVGWTKFKDKSIRIDQDIFVPAARVRKMVVGQNGDTIRSVGIAARQEIEELLKRPVHLYLNVRVRS